MYDDYEVFTSSLEPDVSDLLADYDAYLYATSVEDGECNKLTECNKNTESNKEETKKQRVYKYENIEVNDTFVGIIRVDTSTGEVVARYEVAPATQLTKAEYEKEYKIIPTPFNARNSCHIEEYMKLQRKNKSKITKINNVVKYVEESAGKKRYGDTTQPNITKPMLKTLTDLCNAVKIHNVIVGTRNEVAEILGVRPNHLTRKLNLVQDHIKVFDEKNNMNTGYIKIVITPHLVFAGSGSSIYMQKEQAMKAWYLNRFTTTAQHVKWLTETQEKHEGGSYKFSEDFEAFLRNFKTRRKFEI